MSLFIETICSFEKSQERKGDILHRDNLAICYSLAIGSNDKSKRWHLVSINRDITKLMDCMILHQHWDIFNN